MWIVDSSAFIDWMRRGRNPIPLLKPLILSGQTISCGIIRIEVLRGIVKPAVREEMGRLFDALPEMPLTASLWKEAADLAWSLDRKGFLLPVSDLLIGTCALQARAELVTLDSHFSRIPGLRIRRDLPHWPLE